ncbi:MAG: S8 family peptidase [Verrucomicrobiota bacterium JB022]|nr:S8 family peptidase [Verrucomicrobiota bacterium JB022]
MPDYGPLTPAPTYTPAPPSEEALKAGIAEIRFQRADAQAEARALRSQLFKEELADLEPVPSWLTVTTRQPNAAEIQRAGSSYAARANFAHSMGLDAVPDQYIVTFDESLFPYKLVAESRYESKRVTDAGETLDALAERLVSEVGGELHSAWNFAIAGFSAQLTAEQATALAKLPGVKSVEADKPFALSYTDQLAPWNLSRIDQRNQSTPEDSTYRYDYEGDGVHIYIIDTGLNATHQDFSGRVGTLYDATGQGVQDSENHGTFVAGLAAGTYFGVAKHATIHSYKWFHTRANPHSSTSTIISCINAVLADHNISQAGVANMSLGGNPSPAMDQAVEQMISEGIVVVVSAGNESTNAANRSPARIINAITVGALTRDDAKSPYSNYGSVVDVWGPADELYSASHNDNYDYAFWHEGGTSSASPHVAGAAARILEQSPSLTPDQVQQAIKNQASIGKITGSLGGSANRMLFINSWFYPFQCNQQDGLKEWADSDEPMTTHTVWRENLGWISVDPSTHPWFWRYSDNAWINFHSTGANHWMFWNDSTQGWEAYNE